VIEWEYRKIDLTQHRPGSDELELLNVAGAQGWELVGVTASGIAYLKRRLEEPVSPQPRSGLVTPAGQTANDSVQRREGAHEVKVKYRDPETNETWSGRGRMANWLKRKQEAGPGASHNEGQ
jgi:DNA-binding protein H-NS